MERATGYNASTIMISRDGAIIMYPNLASLDLKLFFLFFALVEGLGLNSIIYYPHLYCKSH
jgi:hypothetical protein